MGIDSKIPIHTYSFDELLNEDVEVKNVFEVFDKLFLLIKDEEVLEEMGGDHWKGLQKVRVEIERVKAVLDKHLFLLLKQGKYETLLRLCALALKKTCELLEVENIDFSKPSGAQIIVFAVNAAAKTINNAFFQLKHPALLAAYFTGCDLRANVHEEVYYLSSELLGSFSFHDPENRLHMFEKHLIHQGTVIDIEEVSHPEWSGKRVNEFAFELVKDVSNGKHSLASALRALTSK